MTGAKPLDDAAIDRIIDAVEHWGDDPDPFVQTFNYAWEAFVDEILTAYQKKHGVLPSGEVKVKFKFDDGGKDMRSMIWLGDRKWREE